MTARQKSESVTRSKKNTAKKFSQKKFDTMRGKVFKTAAPVYKSGMVGGQPRNYGTSKRGNITSID